MKTCLPAPFNLLDIYGSSPLPRKVSMWLLLSFRPSPAQLLPRLSLLVLGKFRCLKSLVIWQRVQHLWSAFRLSLVLPIGSGGQRSMRSGTVEAMHSVLQNYTVSTITATTDRKHTSVGDIHQEINRCSFLLGFWSQRLAFPKLCLEQIALRW
jgi:hypothetical protein